MKLDVIELQVEDFERAVAWYATLFPLRHKEKKFAMFDTGRACLALYKGKKKTVTLFFRSRAIKESYAALKKKGVNVSPIRRVHWGKKFSFTDIEGNTHVVYEE